MHRYTDWFELLLFASVVSTHVFLRHISNEIIFYLCSKYCAMNSESTVKILKIGTPEIITIIVLHLEQLEFTVQYCVQKMQTE